MTSCPFKLIFTYTVIGWQVEVQNPTYNYQAFVYARALPDYQQHTEEIKKIIANILASSINLSKILINLFKKDTIISI